MTTMYPMRSLPPSSDVVVVGARCAGAATAMLLARKGFNVLVVDRGRQGSDTLSTHALMRGGVQQLHHWGLLETLADAGTPPIRTTSFHYGDEVQEIQISPRSGIDALYSPRRTVLDSLLVDAARAAGAQVAYGTRIVDLLRSREGRVRGLVVRGPDGRTASVTSEMVIGADGMRSTIARLVNAETYRRGRHSSGTIFSYWSGLEASGYNWYFRPGVSAGMIPTNGNLTCVFASVNSRRFREEIAGDVSSGFERLLREVNPALSRAVRRARRAANFRGFPGTAGFFRRPSGPGWALVGDAGYFKDPITAHGITDAFRDAELLSRALAESNLSALEAYGYLRDKFATGLFELSDQIASFDWDLEAVREMHLLMSKEMGREVKFLVELQGGKGLPSAALQDGKSASQLVA